MDGRHLLGLAVIAGLSLSFMLGVIGAERNSLRNQIVGTWTLVDWEPGASEAKAAQQAGIVPRGIHVFGADGRFFALFARPEFATFASNGRIDALPEESERGSVAYYGTYRVNNVERSVDLRIEVSTLPPAQVETRQTRILTTVTPAELTYSVPSDSGESRFVFRRLQ